MGRVIKFPKARSCRKPKQNSCLGNEYIDALMEQIRTLDEQIGDLKRARKRVLEMYRATLIRRGPIIAAAASLGLHVLAGWEVYRFPWA